MMTMTTGVMMMTTQEIEKLKNECKANPLAFAKKYNIRTDNDVLMGDVFDVVDSFFEDDVTLVSEIRRYMADTVDYIVNKLKPFAQ